MYCLRESVENNERKRHIFTREKEKEPSVKIYYFPTLFSFCCCRKITNLFPGEKLAKIRGKRVIFHTLLLFSLWKNNSSVSRRNYCESQAKKCYFPQK
jgi:hypothetical protein